MEKGILYGIGVGPGDPELLTIQAENCLHMVDMIAAPKTNQQTTTALDIAAKYVKDKECLFLDIPMIRDQDQLRLAYQEAANILMIHLNEGENIGFITLGDVSFYSTFTNIHRIVVKAGFQTEWIPGVPAMCAVAAKVQQPLAERREMLHVIPMLDSKVISDIITFLKRGDHVIVMKFGSRFAELRDALRDNGFEGQAAVVERCGMQGENVFIGFQDMDEKHSYFSTMLVHGYEEN